MSGTILSRVLLGLSAACLLAAAAFATPPAAHDLFPAEAAALVGGQPSPQVTPPGGDPSTPAKLVAHECYRLEVCDRQFPQNCLDGPEEACPREVNPVAGETFTHRDFIPNNPPNEGCRHTGDDFDECGIDNSGPCVIHYHCVWNADANECQSRTPTEVTAGRCF